MEISRVILAVLLFGLAACKHTSAVTCGPSLVTYSRGFQAEAMTERELIAKYAPRHGELVDDYGKVRNAIRACQKLRK